MSSLRPVIYQFEAAVDKKKIHIEHPIRTLGDHEVDLRLHADVNIKLKVNIESSNPPPPKPEEPAKGAKDAAGRGDRIGRTHRGDRTFGAAKEAAPADKAKK